MDEEKNLPESSLRDVQEKIDYHFQNIELLREALTHKSFANEQQSENSLANERLEFMGDAVLELVITHILMERFRDYSEGKLSRLRAAIVNKEGLSYIAHTFGLGSYILLGRGEEANRGRTKKSILANVYEAIIAAVYYDGGYQKVFDLIERHFARLIDKAEQKGFFSDYKSRLQEYSQAALGAVPDYILTSEEGPDHEKMFEVHVSINGTHYETGWGSNKKAAEQEAAKKTLKRLTGEDMD